MEEKIICSAIWYKELPTPVFRPDNVEDGCVVCGLRHMHCIYIMNALTGKRSVEPEVGKYIQGFLTNKNRFVDRVEGLQIALEQNQIIDLKEVRGNRLHSEDLY